MDMPVAVLLIVTAVLGLGALEARNMKMVQVLVGLAFVVFAGAMFAAGAIEVGVGAIAGGVTLFLLLGWAVKRTGGPDVVAAFASGTSAMTGIVTIVAFLVAAYFAVDGLSVGVASRGAAHGESSIGLVREGLVVVAALAAIWAMLRATGRRGE
jgi:hypothetical protein